MGMPISSYHRRIGKREDPGDEVVVLASRTQKSGTGDNSFVKTERDISAQPAKGGPKYSGWTEPSLRKQPTFGDLPLVSPPNDVWESSAEIPYRWRVTTQIWVVLLISWIKFSTRHDQSEELPRCHQYGISALVSQTSFDRETSGSVAKCRLFSQVRWNLN